MPDIRHSTLVNARVGQVWDVLTTPRLIAQWASTFLPGMYAESAFLPGCEVHWKGPDGAVMLTGRVAEARRGRLLKVEFSEADNPAAPADGMGFSETYELSPEDGAIRLTITCGPLRPQEQALLDERWKTALLAIARLAEAGGAAQMGRKARPASPRP